MNSLEEKNAVLAECMEHAWDAGLVVVVAAGNMGPHAGSVTVPGTNKKVITVGAFDDCIFRAAAIPGEDRHRNVSANRRSRLPDQTSDPAAAPGIWTAENTVYKRYLHGSTRCLRCDRPASGKEPHLTNVEVKMRLKNCARNLNLPKYQQGWGMIDVNLLLT